MTHHQQKQIEVINEIEKQVNNNSLNFSTVSPIEDYENDSRICLTSIHLPKASLIARAYEIINSLKEIESNYYYYPSDSLHMTIKSVRIINDPPHFTSDVVSKAEKIFSKIIPTHQKFKIYFYRLLLFPNNLALIGTTDPELDKIVMDLDGRLNEDNIPDDKQYSNSQYFFSNMTLARFSKPSDKFRRKLEDLSSSISIEPYIVDSVTLLTCNAVLKRRKIIKTWNLK